MNLKLQGKYKYMLRLSPTTILKPQLYIYYFTIAHFVTVWWNYEPRLNPLIHNFIPNSLMHLVSEAVKEHDIDISRVSKKSYGRDCKSSKVFSLHKQTILFLQTIFVTSIRILKKKFKTLSLINFRRNKLLIQNKTI